MKRIVVFVLMSLMLQSFAFSTSQAKASSKSKSKKTAEIVTVTGYIIDNKCAKANAASLPQFVLTHTKDCALMPDCAASGYSVYSDDGKLTSLTKKSSGEVKAFLSKPESKLQVVVKAEKQKKSLKLVSIENQ